MEEYDTAFCDINEVEGKSIQSGVEERTLISPEKTPSKRISVKHIIIERNKKMLTQESEEEMIYFVISGRGTLAVNKAHGDWKTLIESNTAIWIPYGMKYSIEDSGEDSLRCVVLSSGVDSKRAGWTELIDQAPIARDMSICLGQRFFARRCETMREVGSERFTLCGYGIYCPGGSDSPHLPLFGAEEIMYVIRGKGKMTSGEKEFQVRAGSVVYVPPNTMHCAQNTGEDVLQIVFGECIP